jgi:hypothetical protein
MVYEGNRLWRRPVGRRTLCYSSVLFWIHCYWVCCSREDRPLLVAAGKQLPEIIGSARLRTNENSRCWPALEPMTTGYEVSVLAIDQPRHGSISLAAKMWYVKLLCTGAVNHRAVGTGDAPTQRWCLQKWPNCTPTTPLHCGFIITSAILIINEFE